MPDHYEFGEGELSWLLARAFCGGIIAGSVATLLGASLMLMLI